MKAKILLIDIETSPLISYTWGLYDQNIGLNQIKTEWFILSFAAKWLEHPEKKNKIIYLDQRNNKNIHNDKNILKAMWELLDDADIIITHNGKSFDVKKINAKLLEEGFEPYSDFRHIDTYQLSKKLFAVTSHKLEYLAKFLKCKEKKLTKRKFNGFELWKECLAGNKQAWEEMKKYNIQDILTLQDVYEKLKPWDNSINFSVFNEGEHVCSCGSKELRNKGLVYTNTGIHKRYKCKSCGKSFKAKVNELTPEQKQNLRNVK